jgi:uncharacterized MAPEG superfamily protein
VFTTPGSLVAMLLVTYGAKFLQVILSIVLLSKYDNVQASHRASNGEGKDGKKPGFGAKMVQRAWNSHQNSWEAFATFSAAVLLALNTVGDSVNLNILANAFVIVRIAYVFVYIAAFNDLLAIVRSLTWVVSFGLVLQIFAMAIGDNWITM